MQSFLIIGKQIEKAKEYADSFCQKQKIDRFDVNVIESEKAIGIAQVREFTKKIYLKPFKSAQKAVVLEAKNGITVESQNALLKVLEEPPVNTIIIILAESIEAMLPTIISRCKILLMDEGSEQKDLAGYEKILLSLRDSGVGDRLKLAQERSKDKETALLFIEGLILASEALLRNSKDKKFAGTIQFMQKTYTEIKSTNATLRLSLENLLLSL